MTIDWESYDVDIAAAIIVVAMALFGIHIVWAIDHSSGEAFKRGGVLLVLAGVALAGFPYISPRAVEIEAGKRLPPLLGFLPGRDSVEEGRRREKSLRPAAIRSVIIERYVSFGFILVGTLIDGYGDCLFGAHF